MKTVKAQANQQSASANRVQRGVPTGGQFDHKAHAEPTVSLGGGQLPQFTDGKEILDIAYSSGQYWQNRYGQKNKSVTVDLDDIAQETVLRVLEAQQKGRAIDNQRQFINSTAANVTVRSTSNVFQAENRRAYREFEEKRTAMEQRENRSLTQVEQDEIAQGVLDNWHDPRHKPSKDFRTPHTIHTSLDKTIGDGDMTLGSGLVAPESSNNYVKPGSFMDQAETHLDAKGSAHKAEAKRLAWNAVAERADIPVVESGTLSQRQVTKYRAALKNNGVADAYRGWSNGVDDQQTEALFAPFGDLNIRDQEKVVSLLERFDDDRAQVMWESAVGYANNKHTKSEV